MPNLLTRADSLREYLTGAGSDNGAQSSAAASLGNYRSSTEALSYGFAVTNPISNITINYVSGGNAPGAGTLNVVDANTLQWQDASGNGYGPSQSVANGNSITLEVNNAPGSYIRVSRTSAAALTGSATVTLTRLLDNVFSMSDVTSAQATSGVITYRATMVRCESVADVKNFFRWIGQLGTAQVSNGGAVLGASGSGTISTTGSFADWPLSGYCHIQTSGNVDREIIYYSSRTNTVLTVPVAGRGLLGTSAAAGASTDNIYSVSGCAIALAAEGIQAVGNAIATIANETTAPGGVTWNTGLTSGTGLSIGTLGGTAGAVGTQQQIGIWIKRQIPAGEVSIPNVVDLFQNSFDAA